MNHIPNGFRAAGAEDRPLTRRAQAKLQTRDKVLQAAKRLFIERGYEAATIRDIALEAGMSTGAVFANFSDKNHLFHEVMTTDVEAQAVLVDDVVKNHPGPVHAAITALMAVGYKWQMEQLPLLQAAASLSWSQGLDTELGERPQYVRAVANIREMLQQAVARGEIKPDAEVTFIAEMLWDVYNANYRWAVFDGWDETRLNERFAKQTEVILAGVRV